MKRLIPVILMALWLIAPGANRADEARKPNVLFIAIDDMRCWAGYLGDPQAKTPNMDRLAKSGVAFTHAYAACSLCNPSRTALLSGLRPGATGVYGNGDDWRTAVPPNVATLPGYFHAHGWNTVTAGKVFHGGKLRRTDWDDAVKDDQREESENDKQDWSLKPGTSSGGFIIGTNDVEPLDTPEEDLVDWKTASYGVEQLGKKHDKPFFIACGFHRPHLPWHAPRKYFDLFPLENIKVPMLNPEGLAGLPLEAKRMAKPGEFDAVRNLGKWKECVRGYLACIAYTDAQVGRLLDALDQSPDRDNTIVVLWSDNGWHFGEKEHWRKATLWEEATCVPLIWRVPGVTPSGGVQCSRTVDFMSIYPTLCELCGLPIPAQNQGVSIKPLLADPKMAWDRPAISTMKEGNHAVRSEHWRYIHYAGGGEELYNEETDPLEWTNLAQEKNYASVKAELAKWLPTENKPEAQGGDLAEAKKKVRQAAKGIDPK